MSETIINGIIEESQDLHGSLQYQRGDKGDDGVGISDISKTSTVGKVDTYTITLTDGTTKTFTVTNGDDGTNGISVSTVSINESGHLIVTLSDGTNVDAGIAKSDKTDQTFDPLSKNPQSGIAVSEAISYVNNNKPGIKTKDGGEVFTDYINNKATKDNTVFGSSNTSGMYGYKIIGWEGTGTGSSTPTKETARTITVRDKDLDEGKKARDLWSIGNYVCLDCNYHVYDKIKISSISTDDAGNTKIVLTGIFFNSTSTGVDEVKPVEPDTETENWVSNKDKPLTGEPSPHSTSAVSFGNKNIARGKASFTSGRENFTYGDYGFTTGRQNKAGYASFAGGRHNEATGEYSLAYGWQNKAKNYASAALGQGLITSRNNQTVVGRFNTVANNSDSLFVVGNGSVDSRSDAFVVKEDGTATLKKQGTATNSVTRKDYVDKSIEKKVSAVKDSLELDEYSKTHFSITDATEYDYVNDKYPSPVDGQYYALNNSSLKSECEQIYHDSIQPTMAICFNHENRYKVGIDPTTLTDSEDKATYQHLPGIISLYKNKYLHRMSRCGDSYFQRMRLICSLSPVDGWNGATPVFKKAKNFKTSFIFGFLPPASVASESTLLRSTMIFGFRQSSPSKFVNGFKVVNKNQCLLAVSKNGYYFAFGDNIKDGKVYIDSNLDFSNSFETPLTEQNCLFEIEVVNDKCRVIIHNGELTTDPIYFDHTFDCPYYNPDTEDGSGYIGYGIGAYSGMFGNIDLAVLYDDKYKETASKEYVEEYVTNATDQTFNPLSKNPQSGIAIAEAIKNERLIYQGELTKDTDEIKVTKDMDGKPFSLKSVKIFAQVIVSEGLTGDLNVCVRTDGGSRYLNYYSFNISAADGGCRFYSESNYDQYTGITSTTAFAMKKSLSGQGINGSTVKHTISDGQYAPITDIGFFTKEGNSVTTLKAGTKITIIGVDV